MRSNSKRRWSYSSKIERKKEKIRKDKEYRKEKKGEHL